MEAPRSTSDATQDKSAIEGVRAFRRRVLALGFGIITLSIVALLVAIYLQLATPILWGLVLAVLFYPLHRFALRLTRERVTLAAVLTTVLSLAIVFVPAVFLAFSLVDEVQTLWPRLQATLGPDIYEKTAARIEASPFRGLFHWMLRGDTTVGAAEIEAELQTAALSVQEFLLERLRRITKSVPMALIQLGITVIVFFFFLRQGPGWVRQVKGALPLTPEHSTRFFTIAERTLNAVFRGVLLTAATQAVLAGLGYWAVGAPTPLLLTSVTFIAALIPFVGPVAVWVPVVLGLIFTGRVAAAIGLGVWGALVVSLVDNFIRPYLIGRETRLPVFWLFLAILGGLKLFGFLGILVGPITLALAATCYRIYMGERRAGPA